MKIQLLDPSTLVPYKNNPRVNDNAVNGVKESIKQFGFQQPIVIDTDKNVIVGHTRLKAALELGLDKVPCHIAEDLTEEQISAYRILDNKLNEKATWDLPLLQLELKDLESFNFSEFDVNLENYKPVLNPKVEVEEVTDSKLHETQKQLDGHFENTNVKQIEVTCPHCASTFLVKR